MHAQTLISILVWVAVFGFTRVVSDDMSDLQKTELANKLNGLVHHSGWRLMDVLTITHINNRPVLLDPASVITEAISSNRNPIDNSNVVEKYMDIWNMLMCKYAEMIYNYRFRIEHLIGVCQTVKKTSASWFKSYCDCFDLVLIKLNSVSLRFRCMRDALNLIYSLGQQLEPQLTLLDATRELTDFTETIHPSMSLKWSTRGFDQKGIDHVLKTVNGYLLGVYQMKIHRILTNRCVARTYSERSPVDPNEEYSNKKSHQLIPQGMTILEYVGSQVDCLDDAMSRNWFIDLGFAYDDTGNIMIRND